jgi:hypothetical protein
MKSHKIFIYVFVILFGLYCVKVLACKGFENRSMSSSYGKEVIRLANGAKVYAIRESRGLHFNQYYLRQANCGCEPANVETDYILHSDYSALLYKVTDQGLNIYVAAESIDIHKPPKAWANVIATGEYNEMYKNPTRYGITKTAIPHNQWCLINWFRKSSSWRQGE